MQHCNKTRNLAALISVVLASHRCIANFQRTHMYTDTDSHSPGSYLLSALLHIETYLRCLNWGIQ